MTGGELKTIRESLNLSAQALADLLQASGLLKTNHERTVRRWEDGSRGVPEDVAAFVLGLDCEVEAIVSAGRAVLIGSTSDTPFIRYETAEDWARYHGPGSPYQFRLEAAALARLRRVAMSDNEERMRAVRIVSMIPEYYEEWRFKNGREDDAETRSDWARHKIGLD